MPEPAGLKAIHIRPNYPDFLDLPWEVELARWPEACERSVQPKRGLSRHEVQFVGYGEVMFALKELPEGLAEREYELLTAMRAKNLPVRKQG